MTAYQGLLDALRERGCTVHANGVKAKAQCPAHEDHDPSLSISAIEGQILVCCHAGCDIVAVLDALGLTKRDLYDEPKGASYPYDDGRIVHRTPAKRFYQTGNTKGRAQLYRLSKVQAAVKAGKPIYVVEGEKDVHAIESLGAVATCSPMGAGKWHKVDPTPLHGAHVTVIADKDAPGEKHARAVVESLTNAVSSIKVVVAKTGKDAADHIAAGHGLDDFEPHELGDAGRRLKLTAASTITPKRVKWAWDLRMATGTLALLGGREGSGKSTLAYWTAARLTRGTLPGEHYGTPRAVMVCATEDSWEHTIVPRLIAAGADRDLVYQVEVITADEIHVGLNLPRDVPRVREAAIRIGAAMLLLDPLMSRIDASLDTHRDGELRQALEPIAALADRTGLLVLGIIHFNKTGSTDVLDRIMGSKAFVAVARSVSVVVPDPDDDTGGRRLFGTPKNNMGRTDLPSLGFTIESYALETDDGPTSVGQIVFGAESDVTVTEAMERIGEDPDVRTAQGEAKQWLREHLTDHGGSANSADVKTAAVKAGHKVATLYRARQSLRVLTETVKGVMPYQTSWSLPNFISPWGESIDEIDDIDAGQSVLGPMGDTSKCFNYANSDTPPRGVKKTPTPSPTPEAAVTSATLFGEAFDRAPDVDVCPHGIPGGNLPDPFVNGRISCTECRAEASR